MRRHFLVCVVICATLLLPTFDSASAAAISTLTECTYEAFIAKLNANPTDGMIRFACSGTIQVPQDDHIVISKNTRLHAAVGRNITFLHYGSPTFIIHPGTLLSLNTFTISSGTYGEISVAPHIQNQGSLVMQSVVLVSNEHSDSVGIESSGTIIMLKSRIANHPSYYGTIVNNQGTLIIRNSTIENGGNGQGPAGGLLNRGGQVTIIGSTFYDNDAGDGGGISNLDNGRMVIRHSTFRYNGADNGGALYNKGTMTVINSTFVHNVSITGGAVQNFGLLNVVNSTFVDNWGYGAVFINSQGKAVFRNSLLVRNESDVEGDCVLGGGIFIARAGNQTDDASCTGMMVINTADVKLGALAGSPAYFPLGAGSVAIDAGLNKGCPATDQRGVGRPQDGNGDGTAVCDVGAYEYAAGVAADAAVAVDQAPGVITLPGVEFAPFCDDTSGVVRASVNESTAIPAGTYCRMIARGGAFVADNGAGIIGDPGILNLGVIHAVDIYGMTGTQPITTFNFTLKICLQGSGRLFHLDATQSPRIARELPVTSENGYTCGTIITAGIVVLVP